MSEKRILNGSRIEQSVLRHCQSQPNAIAVQGEKAISYGELDTWSEQIARKLVAMTGTHKRIAVHLERSEYLIVVLLAVLRAGCTYIPFDPGHPAGRLQHIVGNAKPDLVITDAIGKFGDHVTVTPDSLTTVPVNDDEPIQPSTTPNNTDSNHRVDLSNTEPDPAYIIFTSGSTGQPKGVEVGHSSVVALIDATEKLFTLERGMVWSWFHSIAFDFSVWEIWGALMTGGTVAVVSETDRSNSERFANFLKRHQVTVLSQTPSAFAALSAISEADSEAWAPDLVIFGGESLPLQVVLPWHKRFPHSQLVNMYGITETTVHVTAFILTDEAIKDNTRSVGHPLTGWTIQIVDPDLQEVPPGTEGEILVGGIGLARQYVNQPDLTAERFIFDQHGTRWYRSGDRGRIGATGELEHLGRIDRQIQLRGYRIEPEEIESVLRKHPAIRDAAILVRQTNAADIATTRLDAYIHADIQPTDMGSYLAEHLPPYMIPTTITAIETWPLTVNGKLDIDKLPAPDGLQTPSRQTPMTAGDNSDGDYLAVATTWAELMGTNVSLDDVFFDLGGNSLTAATLVAALRQQHNLDVSIVDLYQNPTVRTLVNQIREREIKPGQQPAN